MVGIGNRMRAKDSLLSNPYPLLMDLVCCLWILLVVCCVSVVTSILSIST